MRYSPGHVVVALLGLQLAMFAATAFVPGLGERGWHHIASLALVLVTAWAFRGPLVRSRRVLAVGVLAFTVLAGVSGFWLLYWKEGIRVAGLQDWGVWWHVLWSWAATVFFVQHTWINRVAYAHFLRRSVATLGAGAVHVGAYALVVGAFAWSWSGLGKHVFDVESYIPFSLYTWLAVTAPAYGAWLAWRWRGRPAARHRRRPVRERNRLRGSVDLALVPLTVLVVASGVVITFFDPWLDANGWKYVSKFWHVWPSIVFSVLVFVHSTQLWDTMRAHWRKFDHPGGRVRRARPPMVPHRQRHEARTERTEP